MEGIRLGPIGSTTSIMDTGWNETGHKAISLIIVSFDKYGATTIQFGYIKNGALIMSKTYGSDHTDFSRRVVRLNHETEFVTGISGEVYNGNISSLTFHTNQRTHEAFHLTFGSGKGCPEKVEIHSGILERREFVGFFGTCYSGRLRSLNFLVRHILTGVET